MFRVPRSTQLKLGILLLVLYTSVFGGKIIDRVVAVVNKEEILLSDFAKVSAPLIQEYKKKKPDITSEEIDELKKSILDEMINNKLIIQEAKMKKIQVSQRTLDEQIEKIKDQFPSEKAFKEELKKENLTEKKFIKRMKEQFMAEELSYREVTSRVPRTFPEKEIDETLRLVRKILLDEELEGLEEQEQQLIEKLAKSIKDYLIIIKTQEKYNEWIKKLRDRANIRINPIE